MQHRSKSAFSRARGEQKKGESSSRLPQPPVVKPAVSRATEIVEEKDAAAEVIAQASDDWRRQMEEENQRRVESMSAEELEAARREILEHFGPGIGEMLRQSRANREAASASADPLRNGLSPARPRIDSKVLKSTYCDNSLCILCDFTGDCRCNSVTGCLAGPPISKWYTALQSVGSADPLRRAHPEGCLCIRVCTSVSS